MGGKIIMDNELNEDMETLLMNEDGLRFVQDLKHNIHELENSYGFNITGVSVEGKHIVYYTDYNVSKEEFPGVYQELRLMLSDTVICDVDLVESDDDGGLYVVLLQLIEVV